MTDQCEQRLISEFLWSHQRLGQTSQLSTEFSKLNYSRTSYLTILGNRNSKYCKLHTGTKTSATGEYHPV